MTRAVQKQLELAGHQVAMISPDSSQIGCQGVKCAAHLLRNCPNSTVSLMGGTFERSNNMIRLRLWLYDQSTQQTAYLDGFCQSCDVGSTVAVHAERLARERPFGSRPDTFPSYCKVTPPPPDKPLRSDKVFWVVYGEGHNHAALGNVIKARIQSAGAEPVPVPSEYSSFYLDTLKKITAGHYGSRVLGAEVQSGGKIQFFMFDQATAKTENSAVECPKCTKEELIQKIQGAAGLLLDHCFGEDCANQITYMRAPAEACHPFVVPRCGGGASLASGGSGIAGTSGPGIDPKLGKILKGLSWSMFAVSAATAITLFGLNQTSLGTMNNSNIKGSNTLLNPAWTATGLSGVALAIAIPTTILIDRNSRGKAANAPPSTRTPTTKCPY